MLHTLFQGLRLRSAARKYAQRLPAQLHDDYGPSEFYTAKQIEKSAARARLPGQYVMFGYAEFMQESDFKTSLDCAPVHDYEQLRSILRRYRRARPVSSGFAPASGPAIQGEQPSGPG